MPIILMLRSLESRKPTKETQQVPASKGGKQRSQCLPKYQDHKGLWAKHCSFPLPLRTISTTSFMVHLRDQGQGSGPGPPGSLDPQGSYLPEGHLRPLLSLTPLPHMGS